MGDHFTVRIMDRILPRCVLLTGLPRHDTAATRRPEAPSWGSGSISAKDAITTAAAAAAAAAGDPTNSLFFTKSKLN